MEIIQVKFTAEVTPSEKRSSLTGRKLLLVELTCNGCGKTRSYYEPRHRSTGFKGAAISAFNTYHKRCFAKPGKRIGGLFAKAS